MSSSRRRGSSFFNLIFILDSRWIYTRESGCGNDIKSMRIYVKVMPRSSKNSVEKISEGEYKVKLTAPPVDGEANKMLIEILADYFNVSRSSVKIIGGKSAKTKIVEIIS